MPGINLIRNGDLTLARQIFLEMKRRILSGALRGGEAVPSTRELAREAGVSRNTALEAYEMLMAEGFLESRPGSSTRAAEGLNLGQPVEEKPFAPPETKAEGAGINFITGRPDLSVFPKYLWNKILSRAMTDLPTENLGYQWPEGYPPLRAEIAAWLLRSRGLAVSPDSVFVTAGATAALHLLTELLHRPDRAFVLENPGHYAIENILIHKGFPMRRVPVDQSGLIVPALPREPLSAVYVTPSHQFPLGGVLEAGRRVELVRLARAHDFHIIEDDYDSEFRYSGPPLSPLQAMDPNRVVYVGTFSKTLFPALRLGFALVPPALRTEWIIRRRFMDVQNPLAEQAALAEFMRQRKMDRHVRQMRGFYSRKRQALLTAIEETFQGRARPLGEAAGLHLVLEVEGAVFDEKFVDRAKTAGVRLHSLARYCPAAEGLENKLMLGYGHLSFDEIRDGLQRIRDLL